MSALYLIIESTLAIALVLGAHALRKRFGLGLFYASLAFLSVITYWVSAAGLVTQIGPVVFFVSSVAFFTALLVGVFAAYVLDGPSAGRAGLAIISAVAVLWPLIGGLTTLHSASQGDVAPTLFFPGFRIALSSLLAIVMDLIFLAICWEMTNKWLSKTPVFFKVFVVLLGVMWLDVLVFCVVAFSGNPAFTVILKGGFASRFVVALAVTPILTYYLHLQQEHYGIELKTRPLLAIFSQFDTSQMLLEAQEETRQKNLALQTTQERYELALLGANLGTWDWDIKSGTMTYNERWAEILGYRLDEVSPTNENWIEKTHSDDREVAQHAISKHLAGQTPFYECEIRMKHKSGAWVWILDRGKVIVRDKNGVATRACGTHLDISRWKQAEEERLSLERQVQHAQKLESLGVLAGGIAHDFNNILMAILGNADLALEEISPHAPARENLQEIENAARKAAGLAKQMLAYSGKGKFIVEEIHLNEFVREMVHMLEVSISKKVAIKFNLADWLPVFNADATQIRQVIMNLITNASEATGDDGGVIVISTGTLDCNREYLDSANITVRAGLDEPLHEGAYVYLEVSDTGCGMDQEIQEKIFDPFFSTKFTGRGLGMAAVLGIIRGHAGAVKIYSEVGKGSIIKVLFPAVQGSALPVEEKQEQEANHSWRGSGTILLVDDEESIRTVGTLILKRLGFEVLIAKDGRDAVEIYRKRQAEIVCILLDLTMPHLGGEDAFKALKAINPEVKVVLCSGYNEQEATQSFTGKGLAGFIQKPFAKPELQAQLQYILPD